MILVISTSSPMSSVGLYRKSGELIDGASERAPMRASGATISLLNRVLNECDILLSDIDLFVADVGPGSFTGVRVGVTIAKTLGFCFGKKCASIAAFDLVAWDKPVAIPARRDQWHLRVPGMPPHLAGIEEIEEAVGYGITSKNEVFPDARNAADSLRSIIQTLPEGLVPQYLLEPSISTPKQSFGLRPGAKI